MEECIIEDNKINETKICKNCNTSKDISLFKIHRLVCHKCDYLIRKKHREEKQTSICVECGEKPISEFPINNLSRCKVHCAPMQKLVDAKHYKIIKKNVSRGVINILKNVVLQIPNLGLKEFCVQGSVNWLGGKLEKLNILVAQ